MIIGIDGNEANIQDRVGVNQYASELLNALEKLPESQKHEFIIYLSNPAMSHLPNERLGWKYVVLPGRGFWVIRKLMLHLWFSKNKPDVFLTPSHYAPPFLPIPLVLSVMDLGYLRFPRMYKKYDFYQLKYWGAWSMRIAKKIIAISESTKREIVEYYPFAEKKTNVIYLGYNKAFYNQSVSRKSISEVKNKYGIKNEYLLYLGTLKPNKNIERLLDAYMLVRKTHVDLQLVIAGKKGWLFDSIFEKVKNLEIEKDVVFTDFIPEEEKLPLIAGAKVFVNPSLWEGFGIPVLEAMASGTPVVISNVGSLPEVGGEAGILVNPESVQNIAIGINDALDKSYELGVKGIKQSQMFSWVKTARETLRILEQVGS